MYDEACTLDENNVIVVCDKVYIEMEEVNAAIAMCNGVLEKV